MGDWQGRGERESGSRSWSERMFKLMAAVVATIVAAVMAVVA